LQLITVCVQSSCYQSGNYVSLDCTVCPRWPRSSFCWGFGIYCCHK